MTTLCVSCDEGPRKPMALRWPDFLQHQPAVHPWPGSLWSQMYHGLADLQQLLASWFKTFMAQECQESQHLPRNANKTKGQAGISVLITLPWLRADSDSSKHHTRRRAECEHQCIYMYIFTTSCLDTIPYLYLYVRTIDEWRVYGQETVKESYASPARPQDVD